MKKSNQKQTQTFKGGTLDNVGQTQKPFEPRGPAIDETVREYQTECGAWRQGAASNYSPTSHPTKHTVMILDPMPSTGKEADQANTVAGSAINVLASGEGVPVTKSGWSYNQPQRTIHE